MHQALEELREVIGVLRADEADAGVDRPQPLLIDLPALVDESRAAGTDVRLDGTVTDPGAAPDTASRTRARADRRGDPARGRRRPDPVAGHHAAADGPGHRRVGHLRPGPEALRPREHEVAVEIAGGRSNAETAAALDMTVATVKAHVSHILTKLDLGNRTQIALLVHDAGLA